MTEQKVVVLSKTTHDFFMEFCNKNGLKAGVTADKIIFNYTLSEFKKQKKLEKQQKEEIKSLNIPHSSELSDESPKSVGLTNHLDEVRGSSDSAVDNCPYCESDLITNIREHYICNNCERSWDIKIEETEK